LTVEIALSMAEQFSGQFCRSCPHLEA
jgi:hypothetical protein